MRASSSFLVKMAYHIIFGVWTFLAGFHSYLQYCHGCESERTACEGLDRERYSGGS